MGKKVDGFVLNTGIAVLVYLYLRGAIRSRALCMLFAMLGCIIFRRILNKLHLLYNRNAIVQRKKLRKQSGGILMTLACMEEAEAKERLVLLLQKAYEFDAPVEILQQFPSCELQDSNVFAVWKQHCGKERLILCTTARAGTAVRTLAASLSQPKLAIVDADILSQLFAEHPECMFSSRCPEVRKLRRRRVADVLLNRKNVPKCLLMFVSLLLFYILLGNPFYLVSSLLLLLIAAQSLRRKSKPAKLF